MEPDYSRYTKAELIDALEHIDKENYPERVALIQQALAANPEVEEPAEYLFLEDPTPAQQQRHVLGLFALICIGVVAGAMLLPAYFHSFLLENTYLGGFKWSAIFVGICGCLGGIYYYLRPAYLRNVNSGLVTSGKQPIATGSGRHYVMVLITALTLSLVLMYTTFRLLPIALHLYVLEKHDVTEVLTVASLPRHYRNKYCTGKIHLKEYQSQYFDYVCLGFTKSEWSKLEANQKIRLHGSRSALGFLVSRGQPIG